MFNRREIERLEYKIKGREETIAQLYALLDKVTSENQRLSLANTRMMKAISYYQYLLTDKPTERAFLVDGFLRRRND